MSSEVIIESAVPGRALFSPAVELGGSLWGWQGLFLLSTWCRQFWLLCCKEQQPGEFLLTSGQLLEGYYFIQKALGLCAEAFERRGSIFIQKPDIHASLMLFSKTAVTA